MGITKEVDTYDEAKNRGDNEIIIMIWLLNARNGLKERLLVFPENTLGQILDASHDLVGINRHCYRPYFEKSSGVKTSDLEMTVSEFELMEGSILSIVDNSY